jgi:hypothetical protein
MWGYVVEGLVILGAHVIRWAIPLVVCVLVLLGCCSYFARQVLVIDDPIGEPASRKILSLLAWSGGNIEKRTNSCALVGQQWYHVLQDRHQTKYPPCWLACSLVKEGNKKLQPRPRYWLILTYWGSDDPSIPGRKYPQLIGRLLLSPL